jgi:cell shape-determining protein MreD
MEIGNIIIAFNTMIVASLIILVPSVIEFNILAIVGWWSVLLETILLKYITLLLCNTRSKTNMMKHIKDNTRF